MATTGLSPEITTTARPNDEARVIQVLLVDDHQVVLEGLRRILELDGGIQVVGEARSGGESITRAVQLSPDVIIMDLKMPEMDGITATREIKQKLPDARILMLTLYGEDFVRQAIEAGASGYLLKDIECEQISHAVHQVYDGLCPIAPSLTRELVMEFAKFSQNSQSSILTERQREVLKLIAEGMNSAEVGSRLFISPSTVKREMRQILDRLGVNDRPQAVFEAMKRKLI